MFLAAPKVHRVDLGSLYAVTISIGLVPAVNEVSSGNGVIPSMPEISYFIFFTKPSESLTRFLEDDEATHET